jgi:hypothetical protein
VLCAKTSQALQLDGRTLSAGEVVPLRSGSELTILPSFSAQPSLQDTRSGAMFLFMPSDLSAYDECTAGRTGVDGPTPAGAPVAAPGSTDPAQKGAAAHANRFRGTSGADGSGAIPDRAQAQAAYRANLLESLLQRASLGAGMRAGAAPEDALCFAPVPQGQPFRRLPGTVHGALGHGQQPQNLPLPQQLKEGSGRQSAVPPHLLRCGVGLNNTWVFKPTHMGSSDNVCKDGDARRKSPIEVGSPVGCPRRYCGVGVILFQL